RESQAGSMLSAWTCHLGRVRWLQSPAWLGAPRCHTAEPGKVCGNEYQLSNIKRKHKHGWIRRLNTAAGIQVIFRRMHKGCKSLSH
uniref:Large ribosomal subunit protein bL34m n=1 Tax=Suricata suricatta TaxID=37032 RepID=A0A673T1P8_SURSU